MKKQEPSTLRSLLTETTPIRRFPVGVLRQLVGYYGDWRRSRDIMNDADERRDPSIRATGIATLHAPRPGGSRQYHSA